MTFLTRTCRNSEFCSTNWDCAIHGFWSSINSIVSTGADAAGAFFFTAAASPFASSDAAGGPAGAAATSPAEGRDHDGTAADGIFCAKGAAASDAAAPRRAGAGAAPAEATAYRDAAASDAAAPRRAGAGAAPGDATPPRDAAATTTTAAVGGRSSSGRHSWHGSRRGRQLRRGRSPASAT